MAGGEGKRRGQGPMPAPPSPESQGAAYRDRRAVALLTVVVLLCWIPLLVWAIQPLAPLPVAVWGYIVVRSAVDLIVISFAAAFARATGSWAYWVILAGHTFAVCTSVVWMLSLPGVVGEAAILPTVNVRDYAWISIAWVLVLSAGTTGLVATRTTAVGRRGWVLAVVIAVPVLAAIAVSLILVAEDTGLPALVDANGKTDLLDRLIVGGIAAGLGLLVLNLLRWRRTTLLGVWSVLTLVLEISALVSGLLAHARFDTGYYGIRLFSLLAPIPLLYAMVRSSLAERARADSVAKTVQLLTSTDALTGLENRDAFLRGLSEQLAVLGPTATAVTIIDLDDFSAVNDQWGPETGNACLVIVADRLAAGTRFSPARLGDDEFAVRWSAPIDADPVAPARRLLRRIEAPMLVQGHTITLTASAGVATAERESATAEDLLTHAAMALAVAKTDSKGSAREFQPQMAEDARSGADMRHRLLAAVPAAEFVAHFQPLVDLRTRRILGVEALVRWPQQDGSLLAAASFVPVAEDAGLMPGVDHVVFGAVARQIPDLLQAARGELTVHLNLTAPGLRDERLAGALLSGPMREYAHLVVLEVVESSALDSDALATLDRLRTAGYRLAVDDFGTGYSNMALLSAMRPDVIKVDRAFTRAAGSGDSVGIAVVRAAIGVADAIGAKVLLEGMETEQERAVALGLGVELAQGHLFGAAVSAAGLRAALAT